MQLERTYLQERYNWKHDRHGYPNDPPCRVRGSAIDKGNFGWWISSSPSIKQISRSDKKRIKKNVEVLRISDKANASIVADNTRTDSITRINFVSLQLHLWLLA